MRLFVVPIVIAGLITASPSIAQAGSGQKPKPSNQVSCVYTSAMKTCYFKQSGHLLAKAIALNKPESCEATGPETQVCHFRVTTVLYRGGRRFGSQRFLYSRVVKPGEEVPTLLGFGTPKPECSSVVGTTTCRFANSQGVVRMEVRLLQRTLLCHRPSSENCQRMIHWSFFDEQGRLVVDLRFREWSPGSVRL